MKNIEDNTEDGIEGEATIDVRKGGKALQIAQVISGIENVGLLSVDELIAISRKLFDLVRFCDCIRVKSVERKDGKFHEVAIHQCNKFNHHDHQHLPYCKCCQTRAFIYYLAWCLDKLADEGKLPEYNRAHLSTARIRERTYGYIKCKSKVRFRIWRHLNAWREDPMFPMEIASQKWVFDISNLELIEDE